LSNLQLDDPEGERLLDEADEGEPNNEKPAK
jgi:hypothetical protein